MLVVNSVTFNAGLITVNFSVDRADIDPDAGSEDYGVRVIRVSDNVPVTSPNDFRNVSSGTGISTGNVTGFYNTNGTYIARIVPTTGGDVVNAFADSQPFTIGVTIMAGTGQGRLFSARCRMQEPNGRKYPLEGNGLDAAGAIGELQAKLALVDARVTVISAVRLSGALSDDEITAFNTVNAARVTDAGGYNNVDITLRQVFNAGTSTQIIEEPTIRIENAIDGIASASIDGTVNITNARVAALAAAYVDGDGNDGYAAYKGRFVH